MKDELAEFAEKFYQEKLKVLLEPSQVGKFVAIEPGSGCYFVNESDVEALLDGRAVLPDKLFYLMRIGYDTAHQIGGTAHGKRKRSR
jgi:hypothetical protein